MLARQRQVAETKREELARLTTIGALGNVRYRFFKQRGKDKPGFLWTTQPVECFGERGWVSWVEIPEPMGLPGDTVPIVDTFELHKTRAGAKARALNLYQGWLFGTGRPNWSQG